MNPEEEFYFKIDLVIEVFQRRLIMLIPKKIFKELDTDSMSSLLMGLIEGDKNK